MTTTDRGAVRLGGPFRIPTRPEPGPAIDQGRVAALVRSGITHAPEGARA